MARESTSQAQASTRVAGAGKSHPGKCALGARVLITCCAQIWGMSCVDLGLARLSGGCLHLAPWGLSSKGWHISILTVRSNSSK